MENFLQQKYFKIWYDEVSFRRYDRWCQTDEAQKLFNEVLQEEEDEKEYAANNNMDSIYWCWHCKYGCCD